jgi:hypothetical protein
VRPLGPRSVFGGHLGDVEQQVGGVHRELGLDVESLGGRRKRLHEASRKYPVSREHVVEVETEQTPIQRAEQTIPGFVPGPELALVAGGRHSCAHDHVETVAPESSDEFRSGGCVVGVVSVDHDIQIGIDVAEHLADHVALARADRPVHRCAGRRGDLSSSVSRSVVEHVDLGIGNRATKPCDHSSDRLFFVAARDDHGDNRIACRRHVSRARVRPPLRPGAR